LGSAIIALTAPGRWIFPEEAAVNVQFGTDGSDSVETRAGSRASDSRIECLGFWEVRNESGGAA
jgi:hypothetical protein